MNQNNKSSVLDSQILNIDFLGIFKRNKKIFFLSSTIILLIGTISYLKKKPTWGGEFQIVISEKPTLLEKSSPKDNFTQDFLGSSFNQKLKTEIKILQSPSVLKPVYEYVKSYKNSLRKKKWGVNYSNWFKNNLNVSLIRNTAVLLKLNHTVLTIASVSA